MTVTDAMVDRFLSWRLPASVCADLCATNRDYQHPRCGTNLLTADEARQMLEHVLVASSSDTARAEDADMWRLHARAFDVFLNELYAIMVDPCAQGTMQRDAMMQALKDAALRDREVSTSSAIAPRLQICGCIETYPQLVPGKVSHGPGCTAGASAMTDGQRVDFLAELMNLSVLLEMGAKLEPAKRQHLSERSTAIFQRYEFHRRTNDTPIAFRLAVDDSSAQYV